MRRTILTVAFLEIFFLCKSQNVVFIFVDDMNTYLAKDMGINVKTPNLDNLIKESVYFDKAYCSAPCCTPSRASMFTGLNPNTTGIYKNGNGFWDRSEQIINCNTFPELFQMNGYTTFARGKLTHDDASKSHDEKMWSTPAIGNGGFGPFPETEYHIRGKFISVKAWEGPDTDFPDVKSVNQAINFIETHDEDKPFLLTVGLWRPHTPFTAPARFFEMYDSVNIPLPKGYREDDLADVPAEAMNYVIGGVSHWKGHGADNISDWKRFIYGYQATTSFADWSIGQVINALDKSKFAENTIVVITSDNGYHLGEKLKFGKSTMWENSAHVPMLIRMPDKKNGGKSCNATVSLLDIYPTLKELCKLGEPNQKLDGNSLVPFLNNPDLESISPALTCYDENVISLRNDSWRYIQYKDGSEELYNLDEDPFEFNNLANDKKYRSLIDEFKNQMPEKYEKSLGGKGY